MTVMGITGRGTSTATYHRRRPASWPRRRYVRCHHVVAVVSRRSHPAICICRAATPRRTQFDPEVVEAFIVAMEKSGNNYGSTIELTDDEARSIAEEGLDTMRKADQVHGRDFPARADGGGPLRWLRIASTAFRSCCSSSSPCSRLLRRSSSLPIRRGVAECGIVVGDHRCCSCSLRADAVGQAHQPRDRTCRCRRRSPPECARRGHRVLGWAFRGVDRAPVAVEDRP